MENEKKYPPKYKRVGKIVSCSLCRSQRGTLRKFPGEDAYYCENCYKYLTKTKLTGKEREQK